MKPITEQWEDLINGVWGCIKQKDPNNVSHDGMGNLFWTTYQNSKWRLYCILVKNDYVLFVAEKNGIENLRIRYNGNVNNIIECLMIAVR